MATYIAKDDIYFYGDLAHRAGGEVPEANVEANGWEDLVVRADAVDPAQKTVAEVAASVGDDPALARVALDAELASAHPRKTLVAQLEQVAEASGAEQA